MNGTIFKCIEIVAIKKYYSTLPMNEAIKKIKEANPSAKRTEASIKRKASSMKIQSLKQIIHDKNVRIAESMIKNGVLNLENIARDSNLSVATIKKIRTYIGYNIKESPKSINVSNWEDFYLSVGTPKGFECPKLHTKQLNTFKL